MQKVFSGECAGMHKNYFNAFRQKIFPRATSRLSREVEMKIVLPSAMVFFLLQCGMAHSQTKVDPPTTIRIEGSRGMQQQDIRKCLFLAKEISELTDTGVVAKSRGDIPSFNAVVEPYNAARNRWNELCTTPYREVDLIKVEDASGYQLCKFTSAPCMSEKERKRLLAEEHARQNSDEESIQSIDMQKEAVRFRPAPRPSAKPTTNVSIHNSGSIDCRYALDVDQKTECAEIELSSETKKMDAAYYSLRQILDEEADSALSSAQLKWIDYKYAACAFESRITESSPSLKRINCLTRISKARTEEISNIRDSLK